MFSKFSELSMYQSFIIKVTSYQANSLSRSSSSVVQLYSFSQSASSLRQIVIVRGMLRRLPNTIISIPITPSRKMVEVTANTIIQIIFMII